DFGRKLAGKTILIRFRTGSDEASGSYGWDIDNISFGSRAFSSITNTPFGALVDNAGTCTDGGRPAVATGAGGSGPDAGVNAGGAGGGGGSALVGSGGASDDIDAGRRPLSRGAPKKQSADCSVNAIGARSSGATALVFAMF